MNGAAPSPKVVACVPAWNAASFIGAVLESLAAQTYANLDVLISVDACDDGTAEVCAAFAAAHPNVTVLRQASRVGWVGNCTALIAAATGDYLFFALHDDPVLPVYVSRLVEAIERHPGAVIAFSDMYSDRGIESYDQLTGVADSFERARRLLRPEGAWWCPFRGLMRGEVAKRLGGPRRHLGGEYGADWPWLIALALQGEFVRVPEPLVRKNRRPDGLNAKLIDSTSVAKRIGVSLACLREVRRARMSYRDSLRLHAVRLAALAREEWWIAERKLPGRPAA